MARYVGIGIENSFGTPQTTADMFLESGKCTLDIPSDPTLEIDTMEETRTRIKKGYYSPEGDIELALDINSILEILYLTYGRYKFTAGANEGDLNTHEIWAGSNRKLPSFTTLVGKDDGNENDFEHQFYGCVVSKLALSLSDGVATSTVSVVAQKDGKDELKEDVDLSDSVPIAFYEAETMLDNTNVTGDTTSFDFEFDNGVDASKGQAFGSMFAYRLKSQGKTPSIKTVIAYQGDTYLVKFWGSQTGQTAETDYFSYNIEFTDEEGNSLNMYFPRCAFKSVPSTIEGQEEITHDIELHVLKGTATLADGETTVKTSCLATITNEAEALIE